MREFVLKAINYIQDEKIKRKIAPNFALRVEIIKLFTKKLDNTLKELEKEGKIKSGQTLNDIFYEIQN